MTVKETFATLRQNKPLAFLCGASFFYLIGFFAVGGATLFYATIRSRRRGTRVPVTLLNTGIQFLVTPFIPKLIDRFGKKTLFQYCGMFTVIGGVGLFLTPDGLVWFALLSLGIKGIGFALINTADVRAGGRHRRVRRVEDRHAVRGRHLRDLLLHPQAHPVDRRRRAAWALALGGYISATAAVATPVQPESAITAIKAIIGLVPAAAAIIAMLIFITYPLTDQRFREIRDETEARKRVLEHAVLGDNGTI